MNKAHLTISSYAGIVPGASHYWGRIRVGDEEIDIEQKIDRRLAKALNKDAQRNGEQFRYEVGDTTSRFFDRESLLASAIELIQTHYTNTVLFQGNHAILDPQPVLVGPEPFKTEANAIVAEAEANDWWEGDEEVMEDIFDRWTALLKRTFIEPDTEKKVKKAKK